MSIPINGKSERVSEREREREREGGGGGRTNAPGYMPVIAAWLIAIH